MRVLLIEDSERLQRSVGTGLRNAGYAVDIVGDGATGLWEARSNDYDVIVLDLMLPGLDGLSLLTRLRAEGRDTHVLILTARDQVEDRVLGLRTGADDYLVKPFAFDELLARVQALTRRRHNVKSPRIAIGDLAVDTLARTVARGDKSITLSPREYALLEYLALRPGQVVSRREIEAHIYDDQAEPMSNVIDAAIYALRRKIDLPGRAPLIHTRRGMGYVLQAESQ
ncbi:MAG TPA: response regulator transcription factor [Tepidisphaeraceae bacterium]|jgi:DNA-binding response OmpR family regulator